MKLNVIVFICVASMPYFGEGLSEIKTFAKLLDVSVEVKSPIFSTNSKQSTALESSTINFLQGIKTIVLLSYVGLIALIVTLSLKRRKMVEHFQTLKQQHAALCGELEEKITQCSSLSTQTNQKARELTSCTLSVIQKHNVLTTVKKDLKALSPLFDEAHFNESAIGKKFRSVNHDSDADNHNYWDDFLLHFQLLYPNYLSNIKGSGNDITEKELKLAALLRLGLDTKKIAGLLNLSPVSIKVFRHRLRKKLELPEDVNLYNYLGHFDNLEQVNS